MKILLTNDDGINAKGLEILEQIAREISDDVWIVAPHNEQSGAAHSLTINNPLRMDQISEKKFAVRGTPTDCVMLAKKFVISGKIDLVLSGINRGANYAEDITYSGTVAGAMEGTLMGIPSIALSLDYEDRNKMKWDIPRKYATDIIKKLLAIGWDKNNLININFPDTDEVKGVKFVRQGKRKGVENPAVTKHADPKNRPYYWIGTQSEIVDETLPSSDIMATKAGYISITPISMDLTNYKLMDALEKDFF